MSGSLDAHARGVVAGLAAAGLGRRLVATARAAGGGPVVWREGRRMVSFSCNDYLGLATDARVIAAAVAATERYGAGAGASRLVSGDHPLNAVLEARLAALKGTEAACVFGSGYLANAGAVPALVGRGDLVLVDALAHSCIFAGAMLSGARVRRFRHNDLGHLAALLEGERGGVRHALILTDRVFSMDGDLAPVAALVALAAVHDAWLMTDDAHGIGVLPPVMGVPLQMGTLSKAVGAYGGYVCASAAVVALLRNTARTLVYSTGLPPGVLAAAIAGLDVMAAEPERGARPLTLARRFAAAVGLAVPESPIVPVLLGDAGRAMAAAAVLAAAGLLVVAIRPPTVPAGTARLRVTFTAGHVEEDVDRLAELVRGLVAA